MLEIFVDGRRVASLDVDNTTSDAVVDAHRKNGWTEYSYGSAGTAAYIRITTPRPIDAVAREWIESRA